MELKEQIYERVSKMYKQRVWISRIQETIAKVFEQEIPMELIREIIYEVKEWKRLLDENENLIRDIREEAGMDLNQTRELEKKDWWLKELVKETDDKPPYDFDIDSDSYIFHTKDWPKAVPRTTIKAIFESFSNRGRNLSSDEIISEFQLTPEAWNMIKWATRLYKTSLPDDPETVRQLDNPEDMVKYAEEKTKRLKDSEMRKIYDDAEKRFKDSKIREYAKTNRGYDLFMDKLERVIKLYEPKDFEWVKIPEINNRKVKDVFITDAHLGKTWTDGVVVRFKKLTRDLIECEEKNINITFGWDLWELFIPYGEMHPAQRLWTENLTTEELIMLIVDVFENMLISIYKAWKKVTFNWMGWNHDRFTEKKEFDPYRTPAMVVYRFLQKIVENTNIKVNILRDKLNIIKSWKVKYVFLHWDWLSPAQLNRIALEHKESWFYLCIVSGDKHSYKMQEISDDILRVQSPALAWAWKYDKELNLSSIPWAIFFENNSDWLTDLIVKRYK